MNLLKETLDEMNRNGKTLDDILFINILNHSGRWSYEGDDDYTKPYSTDWNGFLEYSNLYSDYDNGYGCAEVQDVFIIFNDNSWLERAEYDGSEWWEYKKTPAIIKDEQDEH